ncbi:SIR2 family NAD-dependent protein deacylase [Azospirillum lipoferum]|nr:SIR2 family protein [Azospirillum lipoferum]
MNRSVVPFVGAGFSYDALHPAGWRSSRSCMPDLLRVAIRNILATQPPCQGNPTHCALLDEIDTATLDRLAEWLTWLSGPVAVCHAAGIADYQKLFPLPSHRYLAGLAREGLVEEVITTNYDCCIETAFDQSFGPASKRAGESRAVVTSLQHYRTYAAAHQRPGHLLIYKVNGCAREFAAVDPTKRAELETAAERIVLTERQLQGFRRENWARDLFQDRARTRTLMFSGFGSDEPQIRHTALTLMEEFGRDSGRTPPVDAMALPNAPFLHSHDGKLSFNQRQVMLGFLHAHANPTVGTAELMPDLDVVCRNVIGPKARADNLLTASDFMADLFVRCWAKRAIEQIDQVLTVWLRNLVPNFRHWTDFLKEQICPGIHGDPASPPSDPVREALSFGKATTQPLFRLLWRMHAPQSPAVPDGWYLPLREEPLQVLATLLLLLLAKPSSSDPEPTLEFAEGSDAGDPLKVGLIGGDSIESLRERPWSGGGTRLVRLIAVPGTTSGPLEGRLVERRGTDPGAPVHIGRYAVLPLDDAIRAAGSPERFGAALRGAFADLRSRSNAALN